MKKTIKILSISLITILLLPINTLALTKQETIFTNLDNKGNVTKTTVNNHLIVEKEGTIEDETRLTDILNLNGKEKFNLDNQKLTWEAKDKDIFYQGSTNEDLPITVKTTYYLDDKEISLDELLGKKGNIKIKLELSNKSYDKEKKLYTPFVITMGTILDNNNRNININNGKVVNTGNRNIVIGIASPGLYENLNIEEFKDLNTIELTYKTDNFKLTDIYLIATPKLLEEADLDIFDKVNTLTTGVNTIQTNMNKIEEGASNLEEGSKKLSNGYNQISTNLNKALNAINTLSSGSQKIDSSLEQVISELNKVQTMLQDKNIEGSLAQLAELKTNNTNAINKLSKLNDKIDNICNNYGLSNLSNISSNEELIEYLTELGVTEEEMNQLFTVVETYTGDFCTSTSNLIKLLNYNNLAIDTTISSLTELSNQIEELLTTLNNALTQIDAGEKQLSYGLNELSTGINKLYQGTNELNKGLDTLSNGTTTLKDGISTLNKEGINKLSNMSNKVDNYSKKIEELQELSKNYKGYAADNVDETIFIYKLSK